MQASEVTPAVKPFSLPSFTSFEVTLTRMEERRPLLDSIDNSSLDSSWSVVGPDQYRFTVHCLSEKKKLEGCYYSVNDIKRGAFDLYPEAGFNDNNALLTYKNAQREFKRLDELPKPTTKRGFYDLYIKFVSSQTVQEKSKLTFGFIFEFRSIQDVASVQIHSAS